ncbi:metal ABC transporter ATP-binding protein [Pseudovibrio sp. Tun.PSC04-5.I4]|uniref:ATP-binding cassette domain-containing protein n=1 Tax=Pseudovibrio sp. Tun.PSC04-5.I4 TaxID=1798213 RepID=UPI00190ED029|nr:metal ABC transporter ATP-binding protein [Pseudovibrio sp. Tun.PSC04-5.I4]
MDGVGIKRQGRWLIQNISLSVKSGEIVTLIGPNGAGKSTTAKTALGVLKADAGSIKRKPNLKVGYVPQKLTIDWTMPLTVRRLMSLTAKPTQDEIALVLEKTGISGLAGSYVQQLSGGEYQRALLARAILRKPDLLVLDEPVQGVDYAGEIALYNLILKIRDELNCGILLISHDLHVVMTQTDTVVCLNGHVCCSGAPEHVAASTAYKQLFGDTAAESLAIYHHHHDHKHLADGTVMHTHDDDGDCSTHG